VNNKKENTINIPALKGVEKIFMMILMIYSGMAFGQQNNGVNDFSKAKIIVQKDLSKPEHAAITMLVEEIEKRTLISLQASGDISNASVPGIFVGNLASVKNNISQLNYNLTITSATDAEGFTVKLLKQNGRAPVVLIIGNDSRGILFGIGYFLRKIFMQRNQILVPDNISIVTHPSLPLRGHQLGYRPKTNAYDGLDENMWEQYIRDLVVFGTNSIELMPPNTDDAPDSPMFPRPQMDMMVKMDQILAKYGLNAWIWYPLMFGDYSKDENIQKSLDASEKIFSQLMKIDAIFIPGGDPGHVQPKLLFKYLEKQTEILHKYHPKAQVWVSPQGFNPVWMNEFLQLLKEEPKWLNGIVYGPQLSMNINEFRKLVPSKYPIRRYPDITHSLDSQYPVPDWDIAFAATEHREVINPRPKDQTAIFHSAGSGSNCGFITYSEGLNDDVNKIVWSGLGWDSNADPMEILKDYSRYFIGTKYTNDFAQGLFSLEENWRGPLLNNNLVYVHHSIFEVMEKTASPQVRLNWRFQLALYRSNYDAYDRSRLLYETQLEEEAMDNLRKAPVSGSLIAMQQAQITLDKARIKQVSEDWKQRVFELAEALFQSTHMQLSVEKYFAIATRRGANLDLINYPLNDAFWLEEQFTRITKLDKEEDRLNEIEKIINWKNPGPGGFYDDLGDLSNQPHLLMGESYQNDPSFYRSPFVGFLTSERTKNWRVSWAQYMQTLYGQPLKMHYCNLDTAAQYEVKVTYIGTGIRLMADNIKVHDYLERAKEIGPVSFDVPKNATADGDLTLQWNAQTNGGTGRGCQIAEVWLIKKQTNNGN
jgi:hypothetical protein